MTKIVVPFQLVTENIQYQVLQRVTGHKIASYFKAEKAVNATFRNIQQGCHMYLLCHNQQLIRVFLFGVVCFGVVHFNSRLSQLIYELPVDLVVIRRSEIAPLYNQTSKLKI